MALTSYPASGEKVRASKVQSLVGENRLLYAVLSTNQDYTSNTTLANVTDLVLPVAINHTYLIEAHLVATSAANAAGDIKYAFTFPAGCTVDLVGEGAHNSMASGSQSDLESFAAMADSSTPTASVPYGTSTAQTSGTIWLRVVVGSTAGNVQLQAAQNSTSVNKSTLVANSWMTGRMVL